MWKLSRKSGYSIIEVICIMGILSVVFAAVLKLQMDSMKLKSFNDKLMDNTAVFEAVRKELLYNCSFDTIKNLNHDRKLFIGEGNLNVARIRDSQLSTLFCDRIDRTKPYIVISVVESSVLKLSMEYHFKINGKDEVYRCEFLKGNYM